MNASHARIYLALVAVVLVAVGGITVAAPPAQDTQIAQTIGALLTLFGVVGMALVATFGPPQISGLTDSQQRSLVLISNIAIGLGAGNTILTGLGGSQLWEANLVLVILGAVGHAIQQQLGSAPPKTLTAPAPTASTTTSIGA